MNACSRHSQGKIGVSLALRGEAIGEAQSPYNDKLTCKEGGPSLASQGAGPYDAVRCSAMLYGRFIDLPSWFS